MLNLFYAEPDPDRWFPYDRFPRRVLRRLLRGAPRPGGQMRVYLNLKKGLDRLGVRYRANDFVYARRNPSTLACIIGKPFLLDEIEWKNPILFGAAVHSHPVDDPHLLERLPIKKVLVPGPWMERMCKPFWEDSVQAWPVGIDSDLWKPAAGAQKTVDILLYDKVRWEHDFYEHSMIEPIRDALKRARLSFTEIRYGYYQEDQFMEDLSRCRGMLFLCEHETQGIAYQQALACGVPVLAWDRGGPWKDPAYFPHKIDFGPVTSVPYWDDRCGMKFSDIGEFEERLNEFRDALLSNKFNPRNYILDNLTLEKSAQNYLDIVREVSG
jgi:hypothetical protein